MNLNTEIYINQQNILYSAGSNEYRIKITTAQDFISLVIQDTKTQQNWKNSFTANYVQQITQKSGQKLQYTIFLKYFIVALKKKTENLFIDIMSSFDLQTIKLKKGGQVSQVNMKANKRYLILSIGSGQNKNHYPLALNFVQIEDTQRLKQMIIIIKDQLEQLKGKNHNNTEKSSSSIISETGTTQVQSIKVENEQLKNIIKQMQIQLAQKKGAVEMDQIIRQKCDLQLKLDNIRREQNKQIIKLKSIYQMKQRQITQMKNQINLIKKQLDIGQQGNPKLKNHIMRVNKVNQVQLNNCKKQLTKLLRDIENLNKNIGNAKNTEKRILGKIKQIQLELDQAKKKANIKEISNRLYSPASSKKSNISAPIKPVNNNQVKIIGRNRSINQSDEASSAASGQSKPRSYNGPIKQNIVKTNLLTKPKQSLNPRTFSSNPHTNPLLKTTPALIPKQSNKLTSGTMNVNYGGKINSSRPLIPKQTKQSNVQVQKQPINKSLEKKRNNFTNPVIPQKPSGIGNNKIGIPSYSNTSQNRSSNSREKKSEQLVQNNGIFLKQNIKPRVNLNNNNGESIINKMDEIKNRFGKVMTTVTQNNNLNSKDKYKKTQQLKDVYKVGPLKKY